MNHTRERIINCERRNIGNEAFSGVLELVVLAVCWCAVVLIASMNSPPSAYAAERIILAGECENDLIACKCCLYDIYMLAVWRKWKSKENFKLEFFFDSSSLKQHFLVSILYNFSIDPCGIHHARCYGKFSSFTRNIVWLLWNVRSLICFVCEISTLLLACCYCRRCDMCNAAWRSAQYMCAPS